MLRIQPRVGDTMYTRFEQSVEMVGTRNVHLVDTTMTSRMNIMILSHSMVQASDGHGTTVLAITDSVAMEGHGTGAAAPTETIRRAMQGRQAQLHISRDGSAELLGANDDVTPQVEALSPEFRVITWDERGFGETEFDGQPFTYWDYRAGMFHKGMGMRIDLVLASGAVAAAVKDAYVDREARKGKGPSDHAPIVVDLDLTGPA